MGFFFLPIVELRPNRLAAGIPYYLLQLEGDFRYLILFLLAVVPLVLAFRGDEGSRGWLLVASGNALLLLTLLLPAQAGAFLLDNAEELLGEGVMIRNPRILPSVSLVLGLAGGYVVLFAGLRDLARAGVSSLARLFAAWAAVALIVLLFFAGRFDVYSVVVEFYSRGEQLARKFVEHFMFVAVSLSVSFVVGVGLGLWASRDERISQPILYAVGIIQTIPSLALFGVLLVPLARLGDQRFVEVLGFFAAALGVTLLLLIAYRYVSKRLPAAVQRANLLLSALVLAVPLALFVVVFTSFIFRVSFVAFTGGRFPGLNQALVLFLALSLGLLASSRYLFTRGHWYMLTRYGGFLAVSAFVVTLLVTYLQASQVFLARVESFQTLTVRNLGVSGIGPAPALIALSLYGLLPLVRNTYAGLKNVDHAIIDSGRGMGMTAWQRFFQIELPIAFPVIMAGVRNAGVALVGIGAIASIIGAGGLGDLIFSGISGTSIDLILLGTVPAVLLAFALDALLRGLERLLTSPGIRFAAEGG